VREREVEKEREKKERIVTLEDVPARVLGDPDKEVWLKKVVPGISNKQRVQLGGLWEGGDGHTLGSFAEGMNLVVRRQNFQFWWWGAGGLLL